MYTVHTYNEYLDSPLRISKVIYNKVRFHSKFLNLISFCFTQSKPQILVPIFSDEEILRIHFLD